MTRDEWKRAIVLAVAENDVNEETKLLDYLVQALKEMEQAKQALRDKGYGWQGLSLLETIRTQVPAFSYRRWQLFKEQT